jgi:hypothetical protein
VAAAVLVVPQAQSAPAKPDFQMPFACGERWEGSTRPTHSPSSLAVDWNRDANDAGKIVVATARGTVSAVVNLGDRSYGLYVVVDHGGGWSTLHAHLSASLVVVGQRVDVGQPIALVGNSGGSSGAHLHYEQRLDTRNQHAVFDGRKFRYNSWLRSRTCVDVPVAGDWNGDRVSDVGAFGRQPSAAVYRMLHPDGSRQATTLGRPTDTPVVGDWNGDGQSDLGTYNLVKGRFNLLADNGRVTTFKFGKRGSLAVAGDWDGDGRDDVATYRPATATWWLRDRLGHFTSKVFGSPGALPVAGDWDGDGRDEIGVFTPATATFSLLMPDGTTQSVAFGKKKSLPVVGDWDGDGIADLGVWNPSTGTFAKRLGPKRTETVRFGRTR